MTKEKLNNIVEESCHHIKELVGLESFHDETAQTVIWRIIQTFFKKMQEEGYNVNVDEWITAKVDEKSKRCIGIAKESIDTFKKTNSTIKHLASSHAIEIEQIDNQSEIDVKTFKDRFVIFQNELLEELHKANAIIHELEEEVQKLQKESNIDPLTKLYNRKALAIDLEKLLEHGREKEIDLAVIAIDVDDFKQVNDNYGHIAGDKILILLSRILQASIRSNDKVYRFGGEEFLILCNRSTTKEAQRVASRILETVRKNKLIYKNHIIRITLSIGIAHHHKGDTFESLIDRADMALYHAKRNGKDQVVTAE